MKVHKWRDIKARAFKNDPGGLAEVKRRVQAELLKMPLRDIREAAGKTQTEVAQALKSTQSEVSRLEHRNDFHLSTLREYVHALGGELEVIANFGKRRVRVL